MCAPLSGTSVPWERTVPPSTQARVGGSLGSYCLSELLHHWLCISCVAISKFATDRILLASLALLSRASRRFVALVMGPLA